MNWLDERGRLAVAASCALMVTLLGQQHASASQSGQGRLTVVSHTNRSARLLFTATGLPAAATVDPASATVEFDGKPTTVTAARVGTAGAGAVERRAVLVFDTSGSMAGAGIAGARHAALAFLASVPADVRVGLVAFADRPRVVVSPTSSRSKLKSAVDRLRAGGETSLYDGIGRGLRVLGNTGDRALVVLSDGADTRSRQSLATVTSALKRSRVRMDAVALHTGASVKTSLEGMASASGGRVTASASAADLAAAFSAAARTFASQVVLDIAIPASDHGRTAELRVTLESSIGQLHAETSLRIGGTSVPSTDAEDPSTPPSPQKTPIELLVLVFAALCVPLIALLVAVERRGSPQGRTKRLLHRYTLKPEGPVAQNEAAASGRLGGLTSWVLSVADRVTANPARRDKLVTRLTRADVSLTPGEWVAIRSIVAFTSGALATVVFGSLVAGLLLAVLGFFASNAWLSIKGRRRLRAFDEYLPASLQLVASSLRTGFSLPQALDGVVREGLEPIAGEFNRALSEARLGMPIEDALDAVSDRMASTDFRWVVMAIRIQREVGGNLAEILLNTAMMMRERAKLRRQVKALSAEGRLSAYVLLALPLLMSLYMFALRRAYIRPLYTTGLGLGMLILAIVLVVAGMFWMRKVVRVEV